MAVLSRLILARPHFYLPVLFCIAACWWKLTRRQSALQAASKQMPEVPTYLPLGLDMIPIILQKYDCFMEPLEIWRRKYGNSFYFNLFGRPRCFVFEPSSIQHFLAKNWENYEKGEEFRASFYSLLGEGIFNVNGDKWSHHRQTARPHFQKVELFKMVPTFLHHAKAFVDILSPLADTDKPIDMQTYFFCVTLDSVGDILLGHNINSLGSPSLFAKAFDYVQKETTWRTFMHPLWQVLPEGKYQEHLQFVNRFVGKIVDETFSDPNLSDRNDLLAEYIKGDPTPTKEYLVDMVKNMLIAGRDTTAVLLTWFFYEISRHPHVKQRIYEEMDRVLGDGELVSEKLEELKYLKQALNETLRLYPSVPIDVRTSQKEDVLPNGFYVPAKADMNYSAYLTHRMEEYWGPDAHLFDPDRWEADRIRSVPSFAFIPFHAGPRICLGQNMAYTEAKVVAVTLMRHFDFELDPQAKIDYRTCIVLLARYGMPMRIHRRR